MEWKKFFSVYKTLSHHRHLALVRDANLNANRTSRFLAFVAMLFVVGYLLVGAIMLSFAAIGLSGRSSVELLSMVLPFFLCADFCSRFVFQQTPMQLVEPYLFLPIRRQWCVDAFVLRSLFSWSNVVWLTFIIPFLLMSVVFAYGIAVTLECLLFFYTLLLCSSQFYAITSCLASSSVLWWLLPVGVALLLFGAFAVFDADTVARVYAYPGYVIVYGAPIALLRHLPLSWLSALALLCLLIGINRRLQMRGIMREVKKDVVSNVHTSWRMAFLDKWGLTGRYLQLETWLLLRNKAPRYYFIMTMLGVTFFSLLSCVSNVYSSDMAGDFWCFYNYVLLGAYSLNRCMSYESNYIEMMLVRKESLLQMLTAKYYLYTALLILPFLLALPTVIWGSWSLFMLVSFGVFTAGFQHCLLLQMSVYNTQRMPLNRRLTSTSGVETNYIGLIVTLVALTVPFGFVRLIKMCFPITVCYLIILVIGLLFVIFHRYWLQNIYQRLMARRYINLEKYRKG